MSAEVAESGRSCVGRRRSLLAGCIVCRRGRRSEVGGIAGTEGARATGAEVAGKDGPGWPARAATSLTVRRGGRETWGVNKDEELRAVGQVVDRLAERFPDISRSSIEDAVWQEHKALESGRVRDYVPVLVEHAAKTRLSR